MTSSKQSISRELNELLNKIRHDIERDDYLNNIYMSYCDKEYVYENSIRREIAKDLIDIYKKIFEMTLLDKNNC